MIGSPLIVLFLFSFAWWWTNNETLQEMVDALFTWLSHRAASDLEAYIIDGIWTILGCPKCLTFWLILFYAGPLVALPLALLASIIKTLEKIAKIL
jgi:hypothetical protein